MGGKDLFWEKALQNVEMGMGKGDINQWKDHLRLLLSKNKEKRQQILHTTLVDDFLSKILI